jgi:hypothetical protein
MTSTADSRFTYARAASGYDQAFEHALLDAITAAIAEASRVSDADALIIRTGETIAALTTALAGMLALSPAARSPTALRHAVDAIAKQLRRKAAAAVADPHVREFKRRGCFDGTDVGGRA